MKNLSSVEQLKPSDIAEINMDSDRILHVTYLRPIADADMDYKVALYLTEKINKVEKSNGRYLGLLIDINHYERLDCISHFGITTPSMKARQLHSRMYKDSVMKRVAYYRKKTPLIVEAIAKMTALYHGKEMRFFNNKEKALSWLRKGIKGREQ